MCGIVGLISSEKSYAFSAALEAIAHRGPDYGAFESAEVSGRTVMLGHRRLSILDLSTAANQPFHSPCGNYTLIYNGEVYNHLDLRRDLVSKGVFFETRSDTEVILKGIIIEGIDFVKKLNGMFAFALLDKRKKTIYLARDPFGIKPLYIYQKSSDDLIFASELRALAIVNENRLEIDPNLISEFLLNGFIYEPYSGFIDVGKVPQGHYCEIQLDSMNVSFQKYYDPLAITPAKTSLEEILRNQVALELEADVPTGVFFSGGLDSTTVAAVATNGVNALCVDYDEGWEGDAPYVGDIARLLGLPLQRISHTQVNLSSAEIVEEFNQVAMGTEEPISDYTFIATRALSRYARESGFKVMLSGMGGDEIFAGYPRHVAAQNWASLRKFGKPLAMLTGPLSNLQSWSKRAARLRSFLKAEDFAEAYTSLVGYFSFSEVTQMVGGSKNCHDSLGRLRQILEPVKEQSGLRQAMYLDRFGFLSHNLTVTDKASMAESIEVRVPLLNPQMESYSSSLPDHALISRGKGKMPFRNFLLGKLPQHLVNRPKVGFNPPLDGRILQLGRDFCKELICTGAIESYIDSSIVKPWIDDHFDGRANHTYRIWQLIYLGLWLNSHKQRVAF